MAETTYFPRRLILAGAMISGVLLALAVHMLGARFGLDLSGLWRSDTHEFMPAGAAGGGGVIPARGFFRGDFFPKPMQRSVVGGKAPRGGPFFFAGGAALLGRARH